MPIHLYYDKKKEILNCSIDQSFSFEELESTFYTITHSAEYLPDVKTLWNIERLDLKEINKDFMNGLISIRKKFPQRRNAKIAIIIPSDLGFGLSRMYEAFSENQGMPQSIHVFRNHADAEKWLLSE